MRRVVNAGTADITPIVHYTCNGQTNQRFKFMPTSASGWFWIVPEHSGKCADVNASNGRLRRLVGLTEYHCNDTTNQRWTLG